MEQRAGGFFSKYGGQSESLLTHQLTQSAKSILFFSLRAYCVEKFRSFVFGISIIKPLLALFLSGVVRHVFELGCDTSLKVFYQHSLLLTDDG